MRSETHLVIVWQNASDKLGVILERLSSQFAIKTVEKVTWSDKYFSENLTRFYGQNLPVGCDKETHIGKGPFYAIVFEDSAPRYDDRDTTKGRARVNINCFDAKQSFRDLTGGGHKIHGTNSPEESSHDLWLLFGKDLAYFENLPSWDGRIPERAADLIGAGGWSSITQLFETLNRLVPYIVLRNFEPLPDAYHMESHGDIDLLVASLDDAVYAANAVKAFPEKHRVHYFVKIAGDVVPFDFRYVGDNYYDRRLEEELINSRRFLKDCFYAPKLDYYFYTLLYHALIHKPALSADYAARLQSLANEAGVVFDGAAESGLRLLSRFFYRNDYAAVTPIDVSVFYHKEHARSVAPFSIGPVFELAEAIENIADTSVLSNDIRQCCQGREAHHLISAQRANVLRPFAPILKGEILEIGAGCGTLTRFLGETGANVTALEESPARAMVARLRNRDLKNVTVLSEPFHAFAPEKKFDVVLLVGVMEFASLYADGPSPTRALLEKARSLLSPQGRLILACDNQLGLKFFAGAPDGVLGQSMYGIEGRYPSYGGQSFGRTSLLALLEESGLAVSDWLLPFPSYKSPLSILTGAGVARKDFDASALAWQSVRADEHPPSSELFSLDLAWPVVFANGLAMDLANSFLVVAGTRAMEPAVDPGILAYHYSTNRHPRYCKETFFMASCAGLVTRCRRLGVQVPTEGKSDGLSLTIPETAPYVFGHTLSWEFVRLIAADSWTIKDVVGFLRRYISIVAAVSAQNGSVIDVSRSDALIPGSLFDLLPQNIIVTPDGAAAPIDLEWTSNRDIDLAYLVFRALVSLGEIYVRVGRHSDTLFYSEKEFAKSILAELSFPHDEVTIQGWIEREALLQAEVTGFPSERFMSWGMQSLLHAAANKNVAAILNEYRETKLALDRALLERDAIADENRAIRNSRSWRLLAPVRFLGHIINGDRRRVKCVARFAAQKIYARCPEGGKVWLRRLAALLRATSSQNYPAIQSIVRGRYLATKAPLLQDPMLSAPGDLPCIDITAVTYNSRKWLEAFADSLLALDYPKDKLNVFFVDNGSTDRTIEALETAADRLRAAGFGAKILREKNNGYGAGHDAGIRTGSAPFILVTNVDLTFEPQAIKRVAAMAMADTESCAVWELRQKPYEHPKYYDPVTGLTNWNAHACVLVRRSAYEAVGGYDQNIFMYGEDVELSYKLRAAGYCLKYCPLAVVYHYSYEDIAQVKPLQYSGSTFANLYLRLKYGNILDRLAVALLACRLLLARSPYSGARRDVLRNYFKLLRLAPAALLTKRPPGVAFPFRGWDYEMTREGAGIVQRPLGEALPRVSIITRTVKGRDVLLRQSLLSVAHQTYPDIEHIVVEDGGESMCGVVAEISAATGRSIRYIAPGKVGRSAAGNEGLAAATGRWCLFLDDDDLLFADHVEVLVGALIERPDAVAAYSLSWMVKTDFQPDEPGAYIEMCHAVLPEMQQSFSRRTLKEYNYMAIQSVMFERSLFTARGGFDEDIDALEDWILWNKYAEGNDFVFVPRVTSLFRTPALPEAQAKRQNAFDLALPVARARIKAMENSF